MGCHKQQKGHHDQGALSGGVFLIGLGLLFLTGWWWPGIMLVIAASTAAKAWGEGNPDRRREHLRAAGFIALIGIAFSWNLWPVFLIGAGLLMLWDNSRRKRGDERPWHEALRDDAEELGDSLLRQSPRPTEAPRQPAASRPADADRGAFDDLTPIYDPERDAPGRATPVEETPSDRPFPALKRDDQPAPPSLASALADSERRIERAKRGDL